MISVVNPIQLLKDHGKATTRRPALHSVACTALRDRLGPVEALRFLSILRTPRETTRRWRDEHFKDLGLDELFVQMQGVEAKNPQPESSGNPSSCRPT